MADEQAILLTPEENPLSGSRTVPVGALNQWQGNT
jgi:hypothetical protein